jgi:dipeptidyl aminopeptidase/acylaminoacyl peptidase
MGATTESAPGFGIMRTARRALPLALALLALACDPAAATFPGRNGDIVLLYGQGARYGQQQMSLLHYAPRLGRGRQSPVCSLPPSPGPVRCVGVGRTAFTPDGARLVTAVAEFGGDTWALWTLSAEGQLIDRVPLASAYGDVRWAPDESAFLAVRNLDPTAPAFQPNQPTGVYILNRDGSERSLLATDATGADWCADGRVVVAQYGEIWVLDLSRPGSSHRLTRKGGAEPSCSPDSREVVFTRGSALWKIPTAGGRARRLVLGHAPVWSPDGKQIAYLRNVRRGVDSETFLYRVGLRRLVVRQVSRGNVMTSDPFSDAGVQDPDWQPIPPG